MWLTHLRRPNQTLAKYLSVEMSVIKLNPSFITKDGKNEFVVLSYEEFTQIQSLLEDLEDLKDLRRAKQEQINEEVYSLEEVQLVIGLT